MVTRFGVAGFRGIGRYQEIQLAPITVVTGPNSAGKSSLLEAIRVSRRLVRTLDHETLIGESSDRKPGRFHPEYVFGGDPAGKTLFQVTPGELLDEILQHRALRRSQPGISVRMTIEAERSIHARFVATALQLFDESGVMFDYSWRSRLRINWRHPLFSGWIYFARKSLEGLRREPELVASAVPYLCGGFEAASMFRWTEPQEADYAYGTLHPGVDEPFDEQREDRALGEFALCDLALVSEENSRVAQSVVEALGMADAISLVMELDGSPWKPALQMFESQIEKLGDALFNRLKRAVQDVDWDARDLYSTLYTRGDLLLQRVRNEVFRSLPYVTLVAADRGTPPSIIVEPPSRLSDYRAEKPIELEERVNAWLGSDKLGTGFRFVREQLLSATDAQINRDSGAVSSFDASRTYKQYLVDLASGMRLSFTDVGYGLSQVLPVLLQLYGRRRASLHIEQPESHLHPALQADLADAAIVSAKALSNQVALETHSEHLILRLLRRIRETTEQRVPQGLDLVPEDIAIYYVAPGTQGATVTRIHVSRDGDFTTHWPAGFFPERLEELG